MTTPISDQSKMTPPHTDVAAYALGLLSDAENDAFEAHLAECDQCGIELEQLMDTALALRAADVTVTDPEPVPVVDTSIAAPVTDSGEPSSQLIHRLVGVVAQQRARRRRRLSFALAAGVALIALAGALGMLLAPTEKADQQDAHTPSTQLLLTGDRFAATDSNTKVDAVVAIEDKDWGTHVGLELKNVRGPLDCQLVAVSRSGAAEEAMTWKVGERGWGTKENPKPLTLHGAISTGRADLDHFEVRTSTGQTLVSIPVAQ